MNLTLFFLFIKSVISFKCFHWQHTNPKQTIRILAETTLLSFLKQRKFSSVVQDLIFAQNDGLQLWVDMGCPPDKLVVGVPFYGHVYILSPNNTSYEPGTPIDRNAKVGTGMSYYQVRIACNVWHDYECTYIHYQLPCFYSLFIDVPKLLYFDLTTLTCSEYLINIQCPLKVSSYTIVKHTVNY